MKTVQQIMQETGAKANIRNFRYMQENYTYKQKVRHAENVARSYQDKCSEMGLNCHVSVGGLDSITLHYFLETCGVHVPCVSCSSLEQKGVQAVHKQIAAEMENTYSAREWLGAHMALPQDEIDTITDPDTRAQEQALHDAFLDNNNSTGVAGTDVKADAVQLEPHDYVPNALQSQNNITRLYSFFNTNEKIVRSSFSENEWISYYEAQVEPDLLQIAAEHTRKLWNRRQRAFGNKLYLESSNLQYASMSTKLSLESMVDRGAMLPNEWRAVFGLAPVAGGDEPIRRLDTAPVKQTKSGGETE